MANHTDFTVETGVPDLLLRSPLALAAWIEREHQRPPTPIHAEGNRPLTSYTAAELTEHSSGVSTDDRARHLGYMQAIADWNPVSAVTAGARDLWGNPNPSSTIQAWPMQHPVEAALLWSLAILAVAAPLASRIFRRQMVE